MSIHPSPRRKKFFSELRLIFCSAGLFWQGCAPVAEMNSDPALVASRLLPDLIEAGIQNGQKTIRIPPGRYAVRPVNGIHLELRYLNGITLDMRGVEMVCSETTLAVLIDHCRDLTILGLTVDYAPLPFTQGELIEISADRKTHLIRLQEGYPPAEQVIDSKYILMTPERTLRFGNYYRFETEALPNNHLRISGLHPQKDGGEQVGDLITISSKSLQGPFVPHGIHLKSSQGTVLEDVTLYASPTFGFFETHCSGSVYRRCVVDRRGDRLRSLNADGFHSKFAEVGPLLEDCKAYWQGDDGINICGAFHMVMGSDGDRLRVLAKRDLDIQPDDPVQLLQRGGEPLPNARVLAVREVGTVTDEDRELLRTIPVLHNVKNLLQKEYEIQIDTPVVMEAGGVIGSLNRMGNGFVIRGSSFGHIRSRGILVKASNGIIENNFLDHCAMQGIKISPEYHWLESGFSENLLVKNNRILNSGMEGILVGSVGPHPIHSNIEILENAIVTRQFPAARIHGVKSGSFRNNRIQGPSSDSPDQAVSVNYSPGFTVKVQTP